MFSTVLPMKCKSENNSIELPGGVKHRKYNALIPQEALVGFKWAIIQTLKFTVIFLTWMACVASAPILSANTSIFSCWLLFYLIVPCPSDELDTSLLPPENLLHCIKESSGHRLCPQTRFRSPENSTQRDSFRLQCANVCVSAFALRCRLACLCVLDAYGCLCVRACVWVNRFPCPFFRVSRGVMFAFENCCISIR